MQKILVAIVSCARDTKNGYNDAVRNTWLKSLNADYRFIIGNSDVELKDDEIMVDCNDDYNSLPYKTLELLKWAVDHGYDYVFKCDTDTYVRADRLLSSGFELYDHVGTFNGTIGSSNNVYGNLFAWASGGSGYWLSRRAMEYIIEQGVDSRAICPRIKIPCEDLWVGQVLGPKIESKEFTVSDDSRYGKSFNPDYKTDISSHYCSEGMKRKFDVQWMFNHHKINSNI